MTTESNANHNDDTGQMENRIVYVRAVRPDELPDDAPKDALFSIHDETGQRVGLAPARDVAFTAARQHALTPVSVH